MLHRRLVPPLTILLLALVLAACGQHDKTATLSVAGSTASDEPLVAVVSGDAGRVALIARRDLGLADWSAHLVRRAPTPGWILGDATIPVDARSGCDAITASFQEAVLVANAYQVYLMTLDDGASLLSVSERGTREYAPGTRAHRAARSAIDDARNAGYTRVSELIDILEDTGCAEGDSR